MTSYPLVTVLMTVYNGEPYLEKAIRSILDQSFQDFEFLIIDNASTDGSRAVVSSFKDPRIQHISNPMNLGPPRALNQGLRLAVGEYVARMDADDVALPDRLARQVDFMQCNPLCAALGTQATFIDHADRKIYTPRQPVNDHGILWKMMFTSPLVHSSVMMRKTMVLDVGGYDERLRHGADYELWSTLVRNGYHIANVDEQHMLLRVHQGADGLAANRGDLVAEVSLVSHRNIREFLGLDVTEEEVTKMMRLLDRYEQCLQEDVQSAIRLLDSITKVCKNKTAPYYGRTLVRLGITGREISLPCRLGLLVKGVWLIVSEKDGQCGYRFFKECILPRRFIDAFLYNSRRLPRKRDGAA